MHITVNGEKREVPEGLTVRGLLRHLNIQTGRVAVELNLDIVRKGSYDTTRIKDGDSLEVVSFMSGGQERLGNMQKLRIMRRDIVYDR